MLNLPAFMAQPQTPGLACMAFANTTNGAGPHRSPGGAPAKKPRSSERAYGSLMVPWSSTALTPSALAISASRPPHMRQSNMLDTPPARERDHHSLMVMSEGGCRRDRTDATASGTAPPSFPGWTALEMPEEYAKDMWGLDRWRLVPTLETIAGTTGDMHPPSLTMRTVTIRSPHASRAHTVCIVCSRDALLTGALCTEQYQISRQTTPNRTAT